VGFVWGVATAAHQIEGGNTNNDWWDFEHDPSSGCAESSGDACDSWHRWEEDVDLCVGMHLGAYRFSLEWSRIEPAEGEFSIAALDHYRRICAGCHERGLLPVVTYHHFTTPRWLAARGGWESPDAPTCLARFAARATHHLGDVIGWACTINEPNVVASMGYSQGEYPPGVHGALDRHMAVNKALIEAHGFTVEAIKSGPGDFWVGMTVSMDEMVAEPGGEQVKEMAEEILENGFLRAASGDDFVGVQTYTRMHFGPTGPVADDPSVAQSQMGYEAWPTGVAYCARRAAAVAGVPVVITENGLASLDDAPRVAFLEQALRSLEGCIADGVDVRGYFVWSLLDNFEWAQGYRPKLGLVEVDRTTFERRPKPSAAWYGAVAERNGLG
jgi:beta-glucosidase